MIPEAAANAEASDNSSSSGDASRFFEATATTGISPQPPVQASACSSATATAVAAPRDPPPPPPSPRDDDYNNAEEEDDLGDDDCVYHRPDSFARRGRVHVESAAAAAAAVTAPASLGVHRFCVPSTSPWTNLRSRVPGDLSEHAVIVTRKLSTGALVDLLRSQSNWCANCLFQPLFETFY